MAKKKIDKNKLPLYEITVNPDDVETGMRFISIVEKPAIEVKAMAFSSDFTQSKETGYTPPCHEFCKCTIDLLGNWILADDPCEFCINNKKYYDENVFEFVSHKFAVNEEEQCLAGPIMITDKEIYRNDELGEYMVKFSANTIKMICDKFFRDNNNRSINVEHEDRMVKAYIQQFWLVKNPMYDGSVNYGYKLPAGSAFIVMKIEDKQFWEEDVKKLGKSGFSIEGILNHKLVRMSMDAMILNVINTLTEEEIKYIQENN